MFGIAMIASGPLVPGGNLSTLMKLKPAAFSVNRRKKSARDISSLVREGNKAVPTQPMYEDAADDAEGGA